MEIPTKEDFNRLEGEVLQLRDLLQTVLMIQGTPTIDVKEVAIREGIDYRSIYKYDYRHYLPGFGVSEFPEGRRRWKLETYMKWSSMPVEERRSMWRNMPAREREKIVVRKKRQIPA